MREWTDATGKSKIKGKFIELQKDVVTLKVESGKSKTVPISKFCEKDQAIARLMQFAIDDERDYALVESHIATVRTNPGGALEILAAANKQPSSSPYIPMFYGITLLLAKSDYDRATALFSTAIKRIQAVQNFDPKLIPRPC